MKAISLFSGAGGFEIGFDRAGIRTVLQAESDPWCLEVLKRHWPEVERVDDVRRVGSDWGRLVDRDRRSKSPRATGRDSDSVDLVYGGFPCQDVSVAGKRAGLRGDRSGLFYEFARVVRDLRPRWIAAENVPGLLSICSCAACTVTREWAAEHDAERKRFRRAGACRCAECVAGAELRSSHTGRDFAHILYDLEQLGYGWAYRVLDGRFFGVPQRRRRVLVVGCLGDPRRAAQVLAVCESCGGHPAPRPEAGEGVAYSLAASVRGTGDGHGNAWNSNYVAGTLQAGAGRRGFDPEAAWTDRLVIGNADGSARARLSRSTGYRGDLETENFVVAGALRAGDGHHGHSSPRGDGADNLIAFDWMTSGSERTRTVSPGDYARSNGTRNHTAISGGMGVRRLTPLECERLSGWPDEWTRFTADGREIADGHRYRMCGNGVIATVAEWMGRRLMRADALMEEAVA